MTHDKNGDKINTKELVKYGGKLWTFESQVGGHINLRATSGDLISVNAKEVESVSESARKEAQAKIGQTTTANAEEVEQTEPVSEETPKEV